MIPRPVLLAIVPGLARLLAPCDCGCNRRGPRSSRPWPLMPPPSGEA